MYRYPNMGYEDYTEDMYDDYAPYYNMYAAPPAYPPIAMYPMDPYMMYHFMNYNMQRPTYAQMDYGDEDSYNYNADDEYDENEGKAFENLRMRTVDISDIRD